MKNIILLPLDERPCNFDFPSKIFNGEKYTIIRPEHLGQKKTPASYEFIRDFKGEVPGASPKDCGNYLDMNLPMANYMAKRYLTEVLENITEKQLDALEENIYLSEFHASKGHAQKLTELDDQFHDILYEACSSKMLEHQLRDFHEYVRRMRKQNLSGSERGLEAVLEHKQIMEAICRKDADRAQELAALHMRNAYDNMIKNGLLDAYEEKERIDG